MLFNFRRPSQIKTTLLNIFYVFLVESQEIKNPLNYPDYFNVHDIFTIKDLFNARVHYGHKIGSLNDKMNPFLFGTRLGHAIFDLDITAFHLRQALNFIAHVAYQDGIILFVCRNPQFTLHVERLAKELKEFAITRTWKHGLFTNAYLTYGCTTRLPDLCIFFNTFNDIGLQHQAVIDVAKMNIPSVGIVDSNCDPNLISYPVPGNDDSFESFWFYRNIFKEAILRGKRERLKVFGESSSEIKNKISDLKKE